MSLTNINPNFKFPDGTVIAAFQANIELEHPTAQALDVTSMADEALVFDTLRTYRVSINCLTPKDIKTPIVHNITKHLQFTLDKHTFSNIVNFNYSEYQDPRTLNNRLVLNIECRQILTSPSAYETGEVSKPKTPVEEYIEL